MEKIKALNLDTPEIKSLTSQMEHVMLPKVADILVKAIKVLDSYSVGAPSLGLDIPAFIINTGLFCYKGKVVLYGDTRVLMEEYCPFKKESVKILRPASIIAAFTTHDGRRIVRDLEGIEARYFQHELDNISGIDFRTRASNAARIKAKKRQLH